MKLVDSLRKARDEREQAILLDKELPNLDSFLNLQISSSDFDPMTRRYLLLNEDETIFLVLEAFTHFPDVDPRHTPKLLLFTNEKLLATSMMALFDFAYLNTLSFEEELTDLIQECKQQILKAQSHWYIKRKQLVYPIDYNVIYDLRPLMFLLPEISFKRRDRLPKDDYSIRIRQLGLPSKEHLKLHKHFRTSFRMWGSRLVMIKKRGYPLKPELKKELSKKGLSLNDPVHKGLFLSKLCLDALRRVPKERKKIMEILFKLKETGERYITEITVTRKSFSQLRCENCGAGQFDKSAAGYKTPEGTYALLRCRYCGFEGIFLKHGLSYKVAFPKPVEHTQRVREERKRKVKFCRACGAKNLSDAIFCQKCGNKFECISQD